MNEKKTKTCVVLKTARNARLMLVRIFFMQRTRSDRMQLETVIFVIGFFAKLFYLLPKGIADNDRMWLFRCQRRDPSEFTMGLFRCNVYTFVVGSFLLLGIGVHMSQALVVPKAPSQRLASCRGSFGGGVKPFRGPRSSVVKCASALISSEELIPGIAAIDSMNAELKERLEVLRDQPYFRLYSVDMLASCEYLPQELFECYSETCEIYPIDDEEVRRQVQRYLSVERWNQSSILTDSNPVNTREL